MNPIMEIESWNGSVNTTEGVNSIDMVAVPTFGIEKDVCTLNTIISVIASK
jgi:hypothetical protein